MKRTPLLLALALCTAACFAPKHAQAADSFVGPGSWMIVGADYGRRFTSGMKGPDATAANDGMDHSQELYDVHQDHLTLSFRGTIWTRQNVTVQGHRGGLHFNAQLGWLFKDNYNDAAKAHTERASMDPGGGGIVFGYKATYPWTILESDSFRWGVGFGFGLLFELGRTTPENDLRLDLDGCLGSVVDVRFGGTLLSGSYEYTPITLVADHEHRVRAFTKFGPLGLGAEVKIGAFNEHSKYFQGGLTLGYAWDLGDDD